MNQGPYKMENFSNRQPVPPVAPHLSLCNTVLRHGIDKTFAAIVFLLFCALLLVYIPCAKAREGSRLVIAFTGSAFQDVTNTDIRAAVSMLIQKAAFKHFDRGEAKFYENLPEMAADLKSDEYTKLLDIMADVQMDRQPTSPPSGAKALAERDAEITHVEEVWENFLKAHTMQELFERCQRMGVRLMPVYTAADQLKDPQLIARNWFIPVEHPELGETLIYPGPPYRFSETPWTIAKRSPRLGEHNEEIYTKEVGFSSNYLSKLKQEGVI